MKVAIKKHIEGMSENEIKDVFQRDYLRRLTRYRMTDDFYMKKYNMDFKSFEKARIVDSQNYTFEVESDAQEWELAIDGIRTVEKRLKELSGED